MRCGRVKGKPGAGISLLFSKDPRGPPGLTSPSEGRIAIKSTYAFTIYALQRGLGFNPVIFGTKTHLKMFNSDYKNCDSQVSHSGQLDSIPCK